MFGVLIESKAKAPRRSGGALLSVLAHTAGLTLAVVLTARGAPVVIDDGRMIPPPPVKWIPLTAAPPGRVEGSWKTARPCICLPVTLPLNFQGKIPPTNVDVVDHVPGVPNGSSFWGDTLAALGGSTIDTSRGGETWNASETSARLLHAARPRYPEMLRAAGVSGRVLVRFVVDTGGYVQPASITIVQSSHDLFSRAVRDVMPAMRLIPAEVGGRRVPMLAEMAFEFALDRR
jgi:protein TonB